METILKILAVVCLIVVIMAIGALILMGILILIGAIGDIAQCIKRQHQKKALCVSPVKIKENLPLFAVWKPSVETYVGYKIPAHPTNWHCSNCSYELCNVNEEPDIGTCPNCHARMVFDNAKKER